MGEGESSWPLEGGTHWLTVPEDPRRHFDPPDDTSFFYLVPCLSNIRGGQVKVAGVGGSI